MKTLCICLALFGGMLIADEPPMVAHPSMYKVRYMPEKPFIKVLLAQDKEALKVEVSGAHNVYDPFTGSKLDSAFSASSYVMKPTSDGIRWGQDFPGTYQVVIVPDSKGEIGVSVNGTFYGGVVAFYQVNDRLAAVNWISLEEFTASLLSSTFLPQDEDQKEAIAAYAIAFRSRAYEQIMEPSAAYWDVNAEECGYKGRSIVRNDKPFLLAMRNSKRIVMRPTSEGLTKKSLAMILQSMPFDQVRTLADEGRDARYILKKSYPSVEMQVIQQT